MLSKLKRTWLHVSQLEPQDSWTYSTTILTVIVNGRNERSGTLAYRGYIGLSIITNIPTTCSGTVLVNEQWEGLCTAVRSVRVWVAYEKSNRMYNALLQAHE